MLNPVHMDLGDTFLADDWIAQDVRRLEKYVPCVKLLDSIIQRAVMDILNCPDVSLIKEYEEESLENYAQTAYHFIDENNKTFCCYASLLDCNPVLLTHMLRQYIARQLAIAEEKEHQQALDDEIKHDKERHVWSARTANATICTLFTPVIINGLIQSLDAVNVFVALLDLLQKKPSVSKKSKTTKSKKSPPIMRHKIRRHRAH